VILSFQIHLLFDTLERLEVDVATITERILASAAPCIHEIDILTSQMS